MLNLLEYCIFYCTKLVIDMTFIVESVDAQKDSCVYCHIANRVGCWFRLSYFLYVFLCFFLT